MKIATLQLIAVCCILAVAFMVAAPFVQMAEAHGKAHAYTVQVTVILITYCQGCGHHTATKHGPPATLTRTHKDGESHTTHATLTLYIPGPDRCSQCPTIA